MKRWLYAGALAGVTVMLLAAKVPQLLCADGTPTGQQQTGSRPVWPYAKVAVIDIGKCIESYDKYRMMRDEFEKQIQGKESELRQKQEVFQAKQEALKQLKDPVDRESMAKSLNDLNFEIQTLRQKYTIEATREQATMLSTVYKEIQEYVKMYCNQFEIAVVYRTMDMKELTDNPEIVMGKITNNPIIFAQSYLDITPRIVEAMNQKSATATAPSANMTK